MTEPTYLICGEALYRCRCVLPRGHAEDVHVCAPACGGSWRPDPSMKEGFDALTLPLLDATAPGTPPAFEDAGNPYLPVDSLEHARQALVRYLEYPRPKEHDNDDQR